MFIFFFYFNKKKIHENEKYNNVNNIGEGLTGACSFIQRISEEQQRVLKINVLGKIRRS